jgi:RNA-directed DNA polymerase
MQVKKDGRVYGHWQPRVIRYADDFVILHRDLEVIEEAKQRAEIWL